MKFDSYLFDALMRDIVGHTRSPAAYLVYLQLYRQSVATGRETVTLSHAMIADLTGLSKRGVQAAVAHLEARQLVSITKSKPTSVPTYRVNTPWRRLQSLQNKE